MGKPLVIKRRLPDGSFGEPVKPFGGETDAEKVVRLEAEKTNLMVAVAELGLENESSITELQLAVAELASTLGGSE